MNTIEMISLGRDLLEKYEDKATNKFFGTSDDWSFTVKDMKSLGLCSFKDKTITVSKTMMEHGESWEIEDTLRHEVAHALAGVERTRGGRMMGHGKLWRKWAVVCGANPRACVSRNNMSEGFKKALPEAKKSKYYIVHKKEGRLEVRGTCNRRLKNLASRGYKDDKSTMGNLWLIETRHWDAHKENTARIERMMFR